MQNENENENTIEETIDESNVEGTEQMEIQTPELKPQETIVIEEDAPVASQDSEDVGDGISVGDPEKLRPVELPLVVKLPEGASKAQIAFAKTLNGYAYQNPRKWALKKDALIKRLKELKYAPDPVESPLKINNSSF